MLGNYVFNLADLSITAGVVVLIYLILKSNKESKKEIPVPQVVEDKQDLP
jgi:lipoprotein signal peptidase